MPSMTIKLSGDRAWPDLAGRPFHHLGNDAPPIEVVLLQGGMASGRPSVAIRLTLPDGTPVVAETSALLFCTAASAIMARHPDLFEGA